MSKVEKLRKKAAKFRRKADELSKEADELEKRASLISSFVLPALWYNASLPSGAGVTYDIPKFIRLEEIK